MLFSRNTYKTIDGWWTCEMIETLNFKPLLILCLLKQNFLQRGRGSSIWRSPGGVEWWLRGRQDKRWVFIVMWPVLSFPLRGRDSSRSINVRRSMHRWLWLTESDSTWRLSWHQQWMMPEGSDICHTQHTRHDVYHTTSQIITWLILRGDVLQCIYSGWGRHRLLFIQVNII